MPLLRYTFKICHNLSGVYSLSGCLSNGRLNSMQSYVFHVIELPVDLLEKTSALMLQAAVLRRNSSKLTLDFLLVDLLALDLHMVDLVPVEFLDLDLLDLLAVEPCPCMNFHTWIKRLMRCKLNLRLSQISLNHLAKLHEQRMKAFET